MTDIQTADTRPRYIDVAEAAKMLRPFLRKAFPSVKFSVRSDRYSMGASISIVWTDGPTEHEVTEIAHGFNGGRFEGMTDCSYAADSWFCKTHGAMSAQTYGCDLSENNGPTNSRCCAEVELVHFGTTSVSTGRRLSDELAAELAATVCAESGLPVDSPMDTPLPWTSPHAYGDYDNVRNGVYRLSLQTSRP